MLHPPGLTPADAGRKLSLGLDEKPGDRQLPPSWWLWLEATEGYVLLVGLDLADSAQDTEICDFCMRPDPVLLHADKRPAGVMARLTMRSPFDLCAFRTNERH